MIRVPFIALALSLSACATDPGATDDSYDPDSKADNTATPTPLIAFYDVHAGKAATIGGVAAKTFDVTAQMKAKSIDILDGDSAYGCVWASAVEVAPSDLAPILANTANRAKFLEAVAYSVATANDDPRTLTSVSRAQLFADVYGQYANGTSTADWPTASRTAFKAALRIAVRSMLSSSSARAYHLSISPDWTDDVWLSVDAAKGVIELIAQGGDC